MRVLHSRFEDAKQDRIDDPASRSHWSMLFNSRNFPVGAAIATLMNHLKSDVSCLRASDCFLSVDRSLFPICSNEEHAKFKGVYLFDDSNRLAFTRAGFATAADKVGAFLARYRQHYSASKAKFPASTFYREFPSLECERASTYKAKTGVFESLQMRMAIGFESSSEIANMLDKDVSEGGIMILSKEDKERIRGTMPDLKSDMARFQVMFTYMCESVYGLAMSPDNNVSSNIGYEKVAGIINTRHN